MTTAEKLLWVLEYRSAKGTPGHRAWRATQAVLELRNVADALPRDSHYDEVYSFLYEILGIDDVGLY